MAVGLKARWGCPGLWVLAWVTGRHHSQPVELMVLRFIEILGAWDGLRQVVGLWCGEKCLKIGIVVL